MIDTFEFLPPGSFHPQWRLRPGVVFGPPMDFSRYYGQESDRAVLRAVTDEIMLQIGKLSGQEYVDMYAKQAKELQAPAGEQDLSPAGKLPLVIPPSSTSGARMDSLGSCEWESSPEAATVLG
jgi:1-acyl-sn-glycerol-3-phosphate acyltransferase